MSCGKGCGNVPLIGEYSVQCLRCQSRALGLRLRGESSSSAALSREPSGRGFSLLGMLAARVGEPSDAGE